MRIAYVININSSIPSGIIPKINEQINSWRSTCDVAVFDLCSTSSESLICDCEVLKVGHPFGLFQRLRLQNEASMILRERLSEFAPDLIYMRYMLPTRQLLNVLSEFPYVVELNTDDTHEFNTGFRIAHYYNKLERGSLLKTASGFVSMTKELAESNSFSIFKKPTLILPNGVDLSLFAHQKHAPESENVLFIGTPGGYWHGLDKIFKIAQFLPDRHFDIVGFSQTEIEVAYPCVKNMNNIKCHCYLSLEESMLVAAHSSVGISTLALHRKSMTEACSLKTRFYLALGLPVILGYNDTDLQDEDFDFILNIGNGENNVDENLDRIKNFILKSSSCSRKEILDFAKRRLSHVAKEGRRLEFFRQIISLHAS